MGVRDHMYSLLNYLARYAPQRRQIEAIDLEKVDKF